MERVIMKIKTGLMAILPIVVGGYALDASAVGKSYEFTAEYSYSDMYSEISLYDYNAGQSYYLDRYDNSFNETNPTDNFVASNPTITGRFSYNTSAPTSYTSSGDTWSYTQYNADAFLINLNSDDGINGRFDVLNPRASRYSHSNGERQSFNVSGWDVNPSVTLSGNLGGCSEFGCGGEADFYGMLPVEQLQNDYPELFSNIYSVEIAAYTYNDDFYGNEYYLGNVNIGARADDLLPADGSLPESLPALENMDSASLNFDFYSYSDGQYGFGSQYIDGVEVVYIDGEFSSDEERYAKEEQISEFVQSLYPELYSDAYIGYNLTGLTELDDGVTPHNPLLPDPETTPEGAFEFTFEPNADDFTFIDPGVAVGYDYEVLEGADFLAILLPEGIGDNLFDLLLMDEVTGEFVDSGIDLVGGVAYLFEEGLSLFRIAGIETDENLDPDDPLAFVTGLKFSADGDVSMTQTAITQTVVPVPPSALLFMSGLAGLFFRSRKA